MAKFINKKEQVFDFQLTTYGREMLSIGSLKPTFYTFFDDNIIYDDRYAGGATNGVGTRIGKTAPEPQNNIHYRIKNETQYLESLTSFEGAEKASSENGGHVVDFSNLQNYPSKYKLKKDIFKFDSAIGDAYLDGEANIAPAWKVVALQSKIVGSTTTSSVGQNIPQIDIIANYNKEIHPPRFDFEPPDVRGINIESAAFIDKNTIAIRQNDPVIYAEEVNTETLTENFDIEVFEIIKDSDQNATLERKFFEKTIPQIVNGIMVSPTEVKSPDQYLTTDSVEYYFDIHTDQKVNQTLACKGAEIFNKQSYYIELDFECDKSAGENVYYDIYGTVTGPEICQT